MEKYDENMFKIEIRGTDYVLTRVTDKEITDCTIPNFVTKIAREMDVVIKQKKRKTIL